MHQVLKDGDYRPGSLRAFITLGQVIGKLHLLWHLEWDPKVRRVTWWSRLLVTIGMACAGFPAFAVLVSPHSHWPVITVPATLPWSITLIVSGLLMVTTGVVLITRAVRTEVEQDIRLPAVCSQFRWIDYYASADPVPNGPLRESADKRGCMEPAPCNEVHNFRSLLTDHNGYLRNQDELLPRLLNDLVAAAYGEQPGQGQGQGQGELLVGNDDMAAASRRRRRRIAWLVRARLLAVALGIMQFCYLPMRSFEGPVKRLVRTVIPHAQMSDDLVRLAVALILMTASYLGFVLLWRLADGRAMLRFLRTTPHCGKPDDSQMETPAPTSHTAEDREFAAIGSR